MRKYYLCFIFILSSVSCNQKPEEIKKGNIAAPVKTKGLINTDSNAPPIVNLITQTNLPKRIIAGNPTILVNPLRSGFGAPIFKNYGTEEGLALSTVQCGMKDRKGNMWWGTNGGGVSRFDGKSFTNFTTANGLSENTVRYMMEDTTGDIWFATWGAGLIRYDGKYFKNYTATDGLVSNLVNCILQDKKGIIWVATEAGVSCFNPKEGKQENANDTVKKVSFTNFTDKEGLVSNSIFHLTEDRKGNIWFASNKDGVSCYNGKSFTNYTMKDGLPSNNVWSVFEDRKGRIWFGTENGASCFSSVSDNSGENGQVGKQTEFRNYKMEDGLVHNFIHYILQDKNDNIWFATYGGGISLYDGEKFTNYTTADGLVNNLVYCITEDQSGNLWFSTFGGGISRYDGQSVSYFGLGKGEMPFGIILDKQNRMWYGSFGGGIFSYDGKNFMNYKTGHGLVNNSINVLAEDSKGNLWIGTENGVSCYDGRYFTNYTTKQGLANNRVFGIVEDKDGYIWFSTYGGGLSRYDGNIISMIEKGEIENDAKAMNLNILNGKFVPSFTNFTTSQGLPSNDLRTSIVDRNNELWIGTGNAGVCHFNGKTFETFTSKNGLLIDIILSIVQDKRGNIWIGTSGGGVSIYDGNSFTNYTTNEGLADNVVYIITEDTINDMLWFGTNLGLSGLKTKTLNDQKPTFEIYNTNTGYPIKDLNSNALYIDNKGVLWAGCGDSRIIRFDYKTLNRNVLASILQIENISINNEPVCWHNLKIKPGSYNREDSLTILNEMLNAFERVLTPEEMGEMKENLKDVQFESIGNYYFIPKNLTLPNEHNNISFDFTSIEPALGKQMKYQYMLVGYDKEWSPLKYKTSADFGNIGEGTYTFKVKALNPFGTWSETSYSFRVLPPWNRTWWAYLLYFFSVSGIFYIIYRLRTANLRRSKILLENKVEKRTEQLKAEKKKSDDLLLNILPSEIADELKQNGSSEAKLYNNVTVLFTDFVNFTGISETMSPTELVQEIHKSFTAFDSIIEKNGLEKIKTIGDAYLAVCGLPVEVPDHALRVVKAAIEIQNYVSANESKFQLRIGVHSGPVVAGIVGVKKYAYDIWGDTVNTANRMESCSEAGKINISGATYELIKKEYKCEHRGKIDAKNKGEVDMYFVNITG